MKKIFLSLISFIFIADTWGQATFKAGWETYNTNVIIREYTYNYTLSDSFRLAFADSALVLIAKDSAVVLKATYPARETNVYKSINYFNAKKQVVKTEEYKGDNLLTMKEWRYDDKNRKTYYYEENKVNGKNYKKNYDYINDKKTGDLIVSESSYFNGRIEFYTKSYYNKKMVKYKEVRLNDNNKDVIHIESYTYDDNGQMKERSVYFPEFKVTKKFTEPATAAGNEEVQPSCSKAQLLNATERVYLPGKAIFLRNFLSKIQPLLTDPSCTTFLYRYSNFVNDVIICTKGTNGRQVTLRSKERP